MKKQKFSHTSGLDFTKKKSSKEQKTKLFLIAFCCFVIVFGALALFMILQANDFSFKRVFGAPEPSTQATQPQPSESSAVLPDISGKATFLFALTDDNGTAPQAVVLVRADLDLHRFLVCALPPATQAAVGTRTASFAEHFQFGGPAQLAQAAENYAGNKVDRFVCLTGANFKKAVKLLGDSLNVSIPQAVRYQSDTLTLNLSAGEQSLKADMLLKLMLCPDTAGHNQLSAQSLVTCAMLDQFLNQKNVDAGETLFRNLINLTQSNISARDYMEQQAALQVLAGSDRRQPAQAVAQAAELFA